jgi:LacI family transcriptional regulator
LAIDSPLIFCYDGNVSGIVTGNVSGSYFIFRILMQTKSKRNVTIIDVAEAAGVSVTTVSRVLNEKGDVSPDTYEKVQKVIVDLGYTSNLAARSMRSSRTNVIGLIIPDAGDPFPIEVMKGVNCAIAALDYDLIIYTCGDNQKHYTADREKKYVSLLSSSITDGLIVVTPAAQHFATNAPLVAIDPHYASNEYPCVISTNHEGAQDAMNYLIQSGHRRIGFISGRSDLKSAERRLRGYQDSLEQAGIPVDPNLILQGDFSKEAGYRCTKTLLELPDRPTAIFCANDVSALGAYEAANECGVSIPGDLSLVGFDNIPEAALAKPGLTTVDQSIQEMGMIAMQMLVKLIKGETLEENVMKTSTRLVIRESCKPLEGNGR